MRRDTRGVLYFVAAVAVALLCALLVGWNLILVENYLLATRVNEDEGHWVILSVGCVFFIVVMLTVVWLVRYLVRTDERTRFQQVLLDSVTHELKSPLASMRLLMETMQLRQLPVDKERELRAMVLDDLERLDNLVDHMLAAGRMEQQPGMFEYLPVRIGELVDRVVDRLRRRRGKEFKLAIDRSGCPDAFMTDGPALEIMLFNLLDNAVKYSPDGAEIRLALTTAGDRLTVTVQDKGFGLERRELRRVFRRFYRAVPQRPEQRREGVGLGLYVVDALVQRLGGRAWADSAGPGQGTTFGLEIPAGTLLSAPSRATA